MNKSKIEIIKLTDKAIITKETEYRDGRIYMRAKVRKLHNNNNLRRWT